MRENWVDGVHPNKAYSKEKNIVRKALKQADFTDIKFSNGHYYFSGFATKNNKVIYFSISDVRHFPPTGGSADLLIRTAKDYKDYTGGGNNWSSLKTKEIQTFELDNTEMLYIPDNYAHAYLTLEPNTIVIYLVKGEYNPNSEHSIVWDTIPEVKDIVNEYVQAEKIHISDKDRLGK